jgi:hypothetical protein
VCGFEKSSTPQITTSPRCIASGAKLSVEVALANMTSDGARRNTGEGLLACGEKQNAHLGLCEERCILCRDPTGASASTRLACMLLFVLSGQAVAMPKVDSVAC